MRAFVRPNVDLGRRTPAYFLTTTSTAVDRQAYCYTSAYRFE